MEGDGDPRLCSKMVHGVSREYPPSSFSDRPLTPGMTFDPFPVVEVWHDILMMPLDHTYVELFHVNMLKYQILVTWIETSVLTW